MIIEDRNPHVSKAGRDAFVNAVCESEDLLSSSPLKAAYYWSLACLSSIEVDLSFGTTFVIRCESLVSIVCGY
jgi:hypothetical protein